MNIDAAKHPSTGAGIGNVIIGKTKGSMRKSEFQNI